MHAVANEALSEDRASLFPGQETDDVPLEATWFIQRMKEARAQQLFRVVTAMNNALNNTSVILLIEALGKKLLFPGDAQWEEWEYALEKNAPELKQVDLYKVGHHGSLNATPKTLWRLMTGGRDNAKSLTTLLSTVTDSKHGHEASNTEVPRRSLVKALRSKSDLRSTQVLERRTDLFIEHTYPAEGG
jgi:hypothetical protein